MRVISLASGSSGNALLIEAGPQGRTKLLLDAGLNASIITDRLRSVGVHPSQLRGVLVTHEHSDHVMALPVLIKRYALPVITNHSTYKAIVDSIVSGAWRTDSGRLIPFEQAANGLSELDGRSADDLIISYHQVKPRQAMIALDCGASRKIGDIEVTSFPISHDAIAPCGYLLSAGGCRVCVVTDSGEVTPAMLDMMQHADLLVLEANHDREMLLRGPYPQMLKQRILGPNGHLSNDQAADAILRTWRTDSVRWLWLAHLSRTNNTPSVALNSIRARLQAAGASLAQIHLSVSPPGMGHIWDSTKLWHAETLWEL